MGIKYQPVTGCCVAVLLYEFGGSRNRAFEGNAISTEECKKQIAAISKLDHNGGYKLNHLAVVSAYLTTEQEDQAQALREIGFTPSEKYTKAKHRESKLIVWSIAAPKLFEWGKNYREPAQIGNLNMNARPNAGRIAAPPPPPPAVIAWDEDFEEEDM